MADEVTTSPDQEEAADLSEQILSALVDGHGRQSEDGRYGHGLPSGGGSMRRNRKPRRRCHRDYLDLIAVKARNHSLVGGTAG